MPNKRRDYSRRKAAAFIAYPAQVVNHAILAGHGLTFGIRDETPPKVVMTQDDWKRLIEVAKRERRRTNRENTVSVAIRLLGKTWRDNPFISRPRGQKPDEPKLKVIYPRKKPSPFAHLRNLPPDEAVTKAREEHELRLDTGADTEDSTKLYLRALETIRKWRKADEYLVRHKASIEVAQSVQSAMAQDQSE